MENCFVSTVKNTMVNNKTIHKSVEVIVRYYALKPVKAENKCIRKLIIFVISAGFSGIFCGATWKNHTEA